MFTVRARDAAGTSSERRRRASSPSTRPRPDRHHRPDRARPEPRPNDTTLSFASSPGGDVLCTFECRADRARASPAMERPARRRRPTVLGRGRALHDAVRASTATPRRAQFTVDTVAPDTVLDGAPPAVVHAGPLDVRRQRRRRDRRVRARRRRVRIVHDPDPRRGRCRWASTSSSPAPRTRPATSTRRRSSTASPSSTRRRAPRSTLDPETGPAPLVTRPAIAGTDGDGDPLSYRLDFGDGQVATGALPVALVGHRYEVAGVYTVRLTVGDGRASASAEREVVVTDAAGRDASDAAAAAPPLTLALSATRLDLGTFIPGLARDYTRGADRHHHRRRDAAPSPTGARTPGTWSAPPARWRSR